MNRKRRIPVKLSAGAAFIGLVVLLMFSGVASAFAGQGGHGLNWRNEGYSADKGWTTGEIGPYDEGSLVPFRMTVTNPSSTKSEVVGGFSLEVSAVNHDVAIFDYTTDWTGPISPDSQDGLVDDMLRTTFPADELTLGPGESATFTFMGHLAVSTPEQPAAGMLNGNGVAGFSQLDAPGVGASGKRVPVKVNSCQGTLGTPAVDIVKSSDAPASGVPAGTMVHYSFAVTNIGDVALNDAHVTDDVLGDIGTIVGPLAPGASATLTAEAIATETVTGVATVLAYDDLGRPATATSELTVSVISSARIFGSGFIDGNGNGAWDAGEILAVGLPITLSDDVGNVLVTVMTDPTGAYEFTDLTPGVTYVVTSPVGGDWSVSCPASGSYVITPASGEDAGPYDIGVTTSGST